SRNTIVVLDIPSVIREVMCWAPATPDTASSIVLVTLVSSSAGGTPNWVIMTEMTGGSTFGIGVTGSRLKVVYPRTTMAIATTNGGSGCLIDHAEILTAISALRLLGRLDGPTDREGSTYFRYHREIGASSVRGERQSCRRLCPGANRRGQIVSQCGPHRSSCQ